MEPLYFEVNLLVVLFLSGLCVRSSSAFPSDQFTPRASLQSPQLTGSQSSQHPGQGQLKAVAVEREHVNTVSVTCHPQVLEVVIKADMFEVGAPVNVEDLRLGVEYNEFCRATAISSEEYRIVVGLLDCGTKRMMTENSLVYTNLLLFSPEASSDGIIRMDEAVVPIECHYERRYGLSSSSITPTWIPFLATRAAVETLDFSLKVMTNDFLYDRGSNVFYLGEPISMEASVRVGHHMALRVFMSSCVATLYPDIYSDPKYTFIENGCLLDSQLPGSRSHFLSRIQDNTLQLVIDAFRFHNENEGRLYITCHLNAVPLNDAEAPNEACTLINGRWRSVDGNDYLCGHCQSQNEVGQVSSGKFAPRGFGKPSEVWEQEARVGPMLILPARKTGPIPEAELPSVLSKISRPSLYGSQWKSGISQKTDVETELIPDPSTSEDEEDLIVSEQDEDRSQDLDKTAPKEGDSAAAPEVTVKPKAAVNNNTSAAASEPSPTAPLKVDVTTLSNATAAASGL